MVSADTVLFSVRLVRFGHLATSCSRSVGFTSPLMDEMFKDTREDKLSGKLLSHSPPLLSVTSLFSTSNCSSIEQLEAMAEIPVTVKPQQELKIRDLK